MFENEYWGRYLGQRGWSKKWTEENSILWLLFLTKYSENQIKEDEIDEACDT
jgi:hypothetical protein